MASKDVIEILSRHALRQPWYIRPRPELILTKVIPPILCGALAGLAITITLPLARHFIPNEIWANIVAIVAGVVIGLFFGFIYTELMISLIEIARIRWRREVCPFVKDHNELFAVEWLRQNQKRIVQIPPHTRTILVQGDLRRVKVPWLTHVKGAFGYDRIFFSTQKWETLEEGARQLRIIYNTHCHLDGTVCLGDNGRRHHDWLSMFWLTDFTYMPQFLDRSDRTPVWYDMLSMG